MIWRPWAHPSKRGPRNVISLQSLLFLVSLVLMVRTRPIILHLVLMLIMKVVTNPPVHFQSLVGQERIPIHVIKYVNLFVCSLVKPFVCLFTCLLTRSFVRSFFFPFRSVGRSAVSSLIKDEICKFHKGTLCTQGKYFLSLSEIIIFIRMWKVQLNSINKTT